MAAATTRVREVGGERVDVTVLRSGLENSNPGALRSRGDHLTSSGTNPAYFGSPLSEWRRTGGSDAVSVGHPVAALGSFLT